MPPRFKIGEKITCHRRGQNETFPGTIIQANKRKRPTHSGWNLERTIYTPPETIFFCRLFDYLTCFRCQPDSLYRYVVKYDDDGYEEAEVTNDRLYKTNPVRH
jgi:hypothetical protein